MYQSEGAQHPCFINENEYDLIKERMKIEMG